MAFVINLLNNSIPDPEVDAETHCLIENAIYEASSEGTKGMRLVTEVVLNRYETEYRSDRTYCGTIYHRLQFSWTRTPKNKLRKYSQDEYHKAAQVVFSYLYKEDMPRILDRNVRHYLNVSESSDQSWFDKDMVVYQYKKHEFLIVN